MSKLSGPHPKTKSSIKRGSRKKKSAPSLTEVIDVINPHAAGIDIGDTIHAVAVNPAHCPEGEPIRIFGTMSCDLETIVNWLKACKVQTVAMESTGVYWKPLFSLLVRNGFDVCLANARLVKNVTGRKDDESDAGWLRRLHSYGLISSSFLPGAHQEALRSLTRFRATLVREASRYVQRVQKCLELMNIKLHTVINDIMGVSGTKVIRAIIDGERNAQAFLPLLSNRLKADQETLVKSLEGTWLDEQLFLLQESFEMYEHLWQRIDRCDQRIEQELLCYEGSLNEGLTGMAVATPEADEIAQQQPKAKAVKKQKKQRHKGNPKIGDGRASLEGILGVDVIAIPGMGESSALTIVAETGTNLRKWRTVKQFLKWLNLCPNNKISGGKLISSMVLSRKPQAAGAAFRAAAGAVARMDNTLGQFFRRMRGKGGFKYAVVATGAKIATIYYHMVSRQTEYHEADVALYEEKYKERTINRLEERLKKLRGDSEKVVV